jgi:hypothetical protein
MWLDDCRIPFVDDEDNDGVNRIRNNVKEQTIYGGGKGFPPITVDYIKQGRFTPNLLVCDDMLNDGSISKSQKTNGVNTGRFPNTIKNGVKYEKEYERGFTDKGTNSRYYSLDLWFDKMINEIYD